MVFTGMLCRFISSMITCYCIERARTKNSRKLMPGTRLFGASWWKIIKALLLYEIVHVCFFLTEAAEIVNAQGSAVTRIGI